MGKVKDITNLVNSILPSYNSAFLKVRGISFPLDIFGTGIIRFMRKIGDIIPVLQPDNASVLTQDLTNNSQTATLDEPIPWMVPNALMRFPLTGEIVTIEDFTTDFMQVTFTNKTLAPHLAGESLELYGYPITYEAFAGTQTIQFGSNASIAAVNGQTVIVEGLANMTASSVGHFISLFAASTPGNNGTFVITTFINARSVAITNVNGFAPDANNGSIDWVESFPIYAVESLQPIYAGDDFVNDFALNNVINSQVVGPVPPDNTRFQVTLSQVLPPTVSPGSTIYFRANPSYESQVLPIPTIPTSSRGIGPGLIDWVSGPLFDDLLVEEVQNYQAYDSTLTNPIGSQIQISKNFLEPRLTIDPDSFLFFRVTRGSINWNGTQYMMTCDAQGEFHAYYNVLPNMQAGLINSWTTQVNPANPIQLAIQLESQAAQIYTLAGGVETTITILNTAQTSRIDIAFNGPPGTTALMRGWVPFSSSIVGGIKHILIAKTSGRYSWASTVLFYKPFILSIDYLKTRLNINDRLNNGLLVL